MKEKKQVKDRYYGFLFFIFVALLLIAGVVAVQQIRVAQVVVKVSSIEDSVTRIEDGVGELIETVRKFKWAHEEASDSSIRQGEDIQVGVGDRRETR